mmetsp:Transcript_35020/g.108986  ORF Transcript_35020/g.108986 Transcript_35020/m.108986 type:complete len:132 (+) Transcript_35020:45-440(+)
MARRTGAAGRVLLAGLAALALMQIAGHAFVTPPAGQLRGHFQQAAASAALAGAVAASPQAARAFGNELRDDGFGGAELTALAIPFVFVVLAYLEWEGKQDPVDDVTGIGTLGKQNDGPGEGAYFRRSPESG